jgi:parallel beta-helix repeat protein
VADAMIEAEENVWKTLLALIVLGLLSASPLSAQAIVFYVDAANGDDGSDDDIETACLRARNANTPLQTINRAISRCIKGGDTVIVKPGVYTESVQIKRDFVTLLAEPRLGATIDPPTGQGVLVDSCCTGTTVEGFIVIGGSTSISFLSSDNGLVRGNVVHSNSANGINFRDSSSGVIENNIVHTNTGIGIHYEGGNTGAARNNLVYSKGDWGIVLKPNDTSLDNIIESNTVDRNARGVRFRFGGGSILNNIITNNGATGLKIDSLTQVQEDYNNVFGNVGGNVDYPDGRRPGLHTISLDPIYVPGSEGGEDDSYHLSQIAAGQGADSPCIDRGSGPTEGSPTDGVTATDNFPDEGILDLGFHYPILRSTLQVFSITSVSTAIAKSSGVLKTTYTISGKFTLGADSNSIHPNIERTRVEVDTYSETLPLGSCVRPSAGVYNCTASSPGVTSLKIRFTSTTSGTFDLIVKLVPTPSNPLPPNVRLRLFIGDDIGVAEMLYVRGSLLAP